MVLLEARAIALGTTCNTTAKVTALHGLTYQPHLKTHAEEAARTYADVCSIGYQRRDATPVPAG